MRTFQITEGRKNLPHFENGNGRQRLQLRYDLRWKASREVIELPNGRGVLEGWSGNLKQPYLTANASQIAEENIFDLYLFDYVPATLPEPRNVCTGGEKLGPCLNKLSQ